MVILGTVGFWALIFGGSPTASSRVGVTLSPAGNPELLVAACDGMAISSASVSNADGAEVWRVESRSTPDATAIEMSGDVTPQGYVVKGEVADSTMRYEVGPVRDSDGSKIGVLLIQFKLSDLRQDEAIVGHDGRALMYEPLDQFTEQADC